MWRSPPSAGQGQPRYARSKSRKNAWNQAPSKSGLEVGASITLKDALYILVVKSANDIAVAIAETVSGSVPAFVDEMNGMAEAMGLTATHYVNPHGLHNEAQVTSARDLAVLALYHPARLSRSTCRCSAPRR